MSARAMSQLYRKVHGEAMRFAKSCDLSPQTLAAIKKARSSSGEDWTTVSVEAGHDTVVRAQILAAFTFASALCGLGFHHSDCEDLDDRRIMILWVEGTESELPGGAK